MRWQQESEALTRTGRLIATTKLEHRHRSFLTHLCFTRSLVATSNNRRQLICIGSGCGKHWEERGYSSKQACRAECKTGLPILNSITPYLKDPLNFPMH